MNEQEVLNLIADGESAYGLLSEKNKTVISRFHRQCDNLHKLLEEVRRDFPDAQYYSANGTVNLMLGSSHDHRYTAQSELSAAAATNLDISGGDW